MTLPFNKAHYANCGWDKSCANLGALSNDAFALAVGAGIDLSVYDNINFVLNNDLDCCAWGGGTSFNGKSYGATWEPPWGQEAGTYSHEFGHSIGLPHSGWTYYAYDSPWDIMSMRTASQSVKCATYFSDNDNANRNVNCTEPGDGYIAAHKDYLGWTPAANVAVIDTTPGTTKVTLEANALPLGGKTKLIKICLAGEACSGGSAHFVSVEARIEGKVYENGLTGDGVIIQDFKINRSSIGGKCYFNSQSGFSVPIDATPGDYDSTNCNSGGRTWPNYALGNAAVPAGTDLHRQRPSLLGDGQEAEGIQLPGDCEAHLTLRRERPPIRRPRPAAAATSPRGFPPALFRRVLRTRTRPGAAWTCRCPWRTARRSSRRAWRAGSASADA